MSSDPFGVERMPPQAVEIEQAVLGAMLMSGRAIEQAADMLDPESFYHQANAQCFRAITELYDREHAVDIILLTEELRRRGQLEQIGGVLYLATLAGQVVTDVNIEQHARLVREKATQRRIIDKVKRLEQRAYDGAEDSETLLHETEAELSDLQRDASSAEFQTFEVLCNEAFDKLERAHNDPSSLQGIMTGLAKLDYMTNGFQPGNLIILAARPSVGKTAFAGRIAYMAAKAGASVVIFSLEMGRHEITQRILSLGSGVPLMRIRTGRQMEDSDWAALTRSAGLLTTLHLWIDDRSALSTMQMATALRRLSRTRKPGLVIVDYLQLMGCDEHAENRQQEVGSISRGLKRLAKDFNVPVLALSQLSRKPEDRSDKRPLLSDLRESGGLEQDADVVLFLHRPDLYGEKNTNGEPADAEVIIGKHRNGPTGTIKVIWDAPCAQFLPANQWEEGASFDHVNNA